MFVSKKVWLVIAVVLTVTSGRVQAQEWILTTGDLHSRLVKLTGLSSSSLAMGDESVPLRQVVSIRRAGTGQRTSGAKFILMLTGGDRLLGEPDHISDEQFFWKTASVGTIQVPLRLVMRMDHVAAVDAIGPGKQDVVSLSNGDSVSGIVSDCTGEKVTVQTDAGANDVPLSSVKRIAFASSASKLSTASAAFRVRFFDGSIVSGTAATISDDSFSMELNGKPATKISVSLKDVISIEQLNGPISWLSLRVPAEDVQIPYFGGAPVWPAVMDAAVDGSPIITRDTVIDRGIGVHAYSRLVYAIEPGWNVFRTQYAIDVSQKLADVTIRIKLDDKVAFEKPHVRASVSPADVMLDLNGAKTLTLEVDYGEGGDTQDRLNWIEPALLREKPKPAAMPAPATMPATTLPTN